MLADAQMDAVTAGDSSHMIIGIGDRVWVFNGSGNYTSFPVNSLFGVIACTAASFGPYPC